MRKDRHRDEPRREVEQRKLETRETRREPTGSNSRAEKESDRHLEKLQEYSDTSQQDANYFKERKRVFDKIIAKKKLLPSQELFLEKVKQKNEKRLKKITYPHQRKDIRSLFMQKGKVAFSLKRAKQCVEDQLLAMRKYGYDFKHEEWTFKPGMNCREVRRKVYIRLECENCRQKGGPMKMWTSIVGTAQITYWIQNLLMFLKKFPKFVPQGQSRYDYADGLKYEKMVLWSLKLYSMECKDCGKYGTTFIYDNQIEGLAKSFCIVLADKLADVVLIPHQDNREKIDPEFHKHEEELCEACKLKKCFNIPKGATKVLNEQAQVTIAHNRQNMGQKTAEEDD